jgi:hypothetical protein
MNLVWTDLDNTTVTTTDMGYSWPQLAYLKLLTYPPETSPPRHAAYACFSLYTLAACAPRKPFHLYSALGGAKCEAPLKFFLGGSSSLEDRPYGGCTALMCRHLIHQRLTPDTCTARAVSRNPRPYCADTRSRCSVPQTPRHGGPLAPARQPL